MRKRILLTITLLAGVSIQCFPQQAQPLYQVTIVSRTTKALNYGYLSAPTRIGFQGTPVASAATGRATVEPKRGSTLLNLQFDHMPRPGRFGAQYLTYVVWAISPDGRAQNLGELILDGSEKGKLSTSTPLQTFAMIVTAEPYYSVAQPGDVVVLENVVTRDTTGKVEEVNATYELLPRKPYTYNMAGQSATPAGAPVSPEQYESITALYQALNAIQIAQSQGADRFAASQIARARQIYNKARALPVSLSKEIVSMAREATQIAEDSRAIAAKREQAEKRAEEQSAAERDLQRTSERSRLALPPPAEPAAPPPAPAQQQPTAFAEPPQQQPAVSVDDRQLLQDDPKAIDNRRRLLAALPRNYEVLDSGRGVMITIPLDVLSSSVTQTYFSAIAAAIKPYPRLHVQVEAHSDTSGSLAQTEGQAKQVRQGLIAAGVPASVIVARGEGNTRLRTSNGTPAGRAQNRRVEIVVTGDAIGTLPTWDRTYSVRH